MENSLLHKNRKIRYLFGSLANDLQAAALATLLVAAIRLLADTFRLGYSTHLWLRILPVVVFYWGWLQLGWAFNLKGMRQAARWLAFTNLLGLTGWLNDWETAALLVGAANLLAHIRLILETWALRIMMPGRLIVVLIVTESFLLVDGVMNLIPIYLLSTLIFIVNRVCLALFFYGLSAYVQQANSLASSSE